MSQHPPELVERVAEQMRAKALSYADTTPSPWADTSDSARDGWRHLARYALDLAERAAAEGLAAGEQLGDSNAPPNYYRPAEYLGGDAAAEAVRRAVGGA